LEAFTGDVLRPRRRERAGGGAGAGSIDDDDGEASASDAGGGGGGGGGGATRRLTAEELALGPSGDGTGVKLHDAVLREWKALAA
jgi:hypothetical protein